MITPEQFKKACGTLHAIVNKQSVVSNESNLGDKTVMETLAEVGKQLNEDTFRVLVMGKFNGGKSTFLNALMGQKLLPADPIPTTAIIGEIVYSDKPTATLYPKNSGSSTINIEIDKLSDYIVINHDLPKNDEKKAENPYRKVVI